MNLTTKTLDVLIWVCLYAGLFGLGLGVWFREHHVVTSVSLVVIGAGLVAAGIVLLWLRSRRP